MIIRELHRLFLNAGSLSTDTRDIKKNALFFALKGEHFDAHEFLSKALLDGASYVVLDNPHFNKKDERYILVENVLRTLQKLATYHRNYLGIPILALTGSNGKTTTKELITAVLSKKYDTIATQGNLNNHLGVPLTLLSMKKHHEIGIVEMGANHFGEIATLAIIASPDCGYITNFGKAHLEGFGSLEGVVKAKSELYDFLKLHNGFVFVNTKDPVQVLKSENLSSIPLENVSLVPNKDEFISVKYNGVEIHTKLIGAYNLTNIAAAITIGAFFKVDIIHIKNAIENYAPKNKRSQLIVKNNVKIILDAYNANPTSMEAAIENFALQTHAKKILILGDMFELGENSIAEHQHIMDIVSKIGFEKVILIGKLFNQIEAKNTDSFIDFEAFKNTFNIATFQNHTILIKGSRGMALERILDLFDEALDI